MSAAAAWAAPLRLHFGFRHGHYPSLVVVLPTLVAIHVQLPLLIVSPPPTLSAVAALDPPPPKIPL
jgi:hypothetical protein